MDNEQFNEQVSRIIDECENMIIALGDYQTTTYKDAQQQQIRIKAEQLGDAVIELEEMVDTHDYRMRVVFIEGEVGRIKWVFDDVSVTRTMEQQHAYIQEKIQFIASLVIKLKKEVNISNQ